jgi:hypothetical protein
MRITPSTNTEVDVGEVANEKDLELLNHLNSDSEYDVPWNMLHVDDVFDIYDSDDDIVEQPEGDPNCMCCIIVMFHLTFICYICITVDTNFCIWFLCRKNLPRRSNSEVAHSSRGRTIILTKATIAGSASRRGNDNGARGSKGWRVTATAPRAGRGAAIARGGRGATTAQGGRGRRLEFIFEEINDNDVAENDDTYEGYCEDECDDEGAEVENVVEA